MERIYPKYVVWLVWTGRTTESSSSSSNKIVLQRLIYKKGVVGGELIINMAAQILLNFIKIGNWKQGTSIQVIVAVLHFSSIYLL